MCGIYGSTVPYSREMVLAKLNRIRFRGPDYSAFMQYDDVILGHNRLSIIDLDHRSDQPLKYLHLTIVFNGEIYNYLDVRKTLQGKGYAFKTESDTEVICAAYLEYGVQCVNHLNGMFAFVIYNAKDKTLFGARDRLGKKPFYYSIHSRGFEFASQPSVIAMGNDFTVDQNALNFFLYCSYIPEPLCVYQEVRKLQAGCYFTYNITRRELLIKQYWDIDYRWEKKFTGTYADAVAELKLILKDAVNVRMHADVPIGVFLSSGIDSSLVAAIAADTHPDVKTFNIRFNEKGYDESVASAEIASIIGTRHHTIECSFREGLNMIENYGHYFDEPFADPSAIPGLLLAKHTKQYVTVALSGDGGDENFLGYHRYRWMDRINPVYSSPMLVRKAIAWLINLSPNYRHKLLSLTLTQKDLITLYLRICGGMDFSHLALSPEEVIPQGHPALDHVHKPVLEKISDYDLKTYLNEDINTKVDRSSMAYAVESRAPYLDYRVVEFARSLPSDFKMTGVVQKRILKDILFERIPEKIFKRPKAGFSVPLRSWFRHELKDYVYDNLTARNLADIPGIDADVSLNLIKEHMDGKWNRSQFIWSLLVLNQWKQMQPKLSAETILTPNHEPHHQ